MKKTILLAASLLFSHDLPAQQADAPSPASAGRPNILFIISDDLRTELGCYGVAGIKTPHIDQLAATSVRFHQAYAQYPLCNPSRSSLLTGRYPTTTGVLDNNRWWGAAHPDWRSLPRWFKEHGYATLKVGKIFHGGIDDSEAWTAGGIPREFTGAVRPSSRPGEESRAQAASKRKTPAKEAKAPKKDAAASRSDRIVVLEGDGEKHTDYESATKTIEHLRAQARSGRPFFLACGFHQPHSPPSAPRKIFELYDPAKVPLPVDFAPRPTPPKGFPEFSLPKQNFDLFIDRDASVTEAHEVKRAYWAAVSFVDSLVGRVLTALRESGLDRNTIIVFWGDHGYHLGEKGKWSKHNSLFEVGTRVPLLIRVPGGAANGRVSPRIVQTLDIYPTLVDLCGLPAPTGLEGVSLRPLLTDPDAPWARPAFSVSLRSSGDLRNIVGHTVRTERWRYAEWAGGKQGTLLIDRAADPDELVNLAADPAHAAVVAEMQNLLDRFPSAATP